MKDMILMPKKLSTENGAKYLLIGEFFEQIERTCFCDNDYNCEICGGTGRYIDVIQISWTTIKDIYKKIVQNLGKEADNKSLNLT